ncbi:sensor histidine kinase [Hymenobacter elongatus]|uniref:histidine kinase n=1 Tax=Hymenobacter elongatus TaxID=877208 RepID=A0A4Z0PKJ7_9BACT|nr:PAS domain-containing sensor histidine kinase [Hymenobacter elongatus]TGE16275.1 PAS domain S-box protein [Hymenobacter elongatus]
MPPKASPPIATSEVRFRSLFDNTPELILYQNEKAIILDANPAFLALVAEPRGRVVDHCYDDFLPPEVHALFRQKLEEAFAGKTVRFDMFAAQGKSAPRHWDVVKIPLWENGAVVGVHMIARDITEKMLAQQEIVTQNQDLQQFTYIVSHNLRAPLATALGLVDLLGTEEPDSPYFEETRTHLQASLHQLDLVLRDMNTILAIRDQKNLAEAEAVPLAEVVQQVVQNLQEVVAQCGGTVRVAIPADLSLRANRAYLYSIFFNLLSNALKYRADERPLEVSVTATGGEGKETRITVADNGSGFDQQQAGDDVFRLYKRFHPHRPGRGLGLYLTKTHVESMGGHISVHSRVAEGTRFIIVVPY